MPFKQSKSPSSKSLSGPRRPWEPLQMPEIPTLSPNQNRFLAIVSETGSLDLAMSCAGLTKDEATRIPEAFITEARCEYDQSRIADAKRLVTRARDVALLSENPKDMLAVAEML